MLVLVWRLGNSLKCFKRSSSKATASYPQTPCQHRTSGSADRSSRRYVSTGHLVAPTMPVEVAGCQYRTTRSKHVGR
eukprot:829899-Rhodomonas_salina.3